MANLSKRKCRTAPWVAALGVASIAAAAPLQAQASDVLRSAARLHAGTTIRVHGPAGRLTGRVLHASETGLLLGIVTGTEAEARDTITVSLSEIDTLWVRGRATKPGAIVGGLAGLALGVLYGAAIQQACETDCTAAIPVLAVGGAAAGALVGGVVGAAIPRWRRRLP